MLIEVLELELEQPELEMIHLLSRFWPHTLCKRVATTIRAFSETHGHLVFELAAILAGLHICAPQAVQSAQARPIRERPGTEESGECTVCCVVCTVCWSREREGRWSWSSRR